MPAALDAQHQPFGATIQRKNGDRKKYGQNILSFPTFFALSTSKDIREAFQAMLAQFKAMFAPLLRLVRHAA